MNAARARRPQPQRWASATAGQQIRWIVRQQIGWIVRPRRHGRFGVFGGVRSGEEACATSAHLFASDLLISRIAAHRVINRRLHTPTLQLRDWLRVDCPLPPLRAVCPSSPAAGGVSPSPPPVVGPLTLPPDGPSAEPDGDSTPEADESVPSEPPGDAAPPLGDAARPPADDARVVEDLVVDAESPVDEDLLVDEDVVVEADLLVDEDVVVDAESRVDEDVVVDAESRVDEDAEPESDGSAYAMPGVVATAIPTPRATANAPTRPMCLT